MAGNVFSVGFTRGVFQVVGPRAPAGLALLDGEDFIRRKIS